MHDVCAMGDDAPFAGKAILIAGCCQDLTEAAARLFARQGAERILIGGRSIERGQAVAAILSAAGCEAEFLPADFAKLDDCAALIAAADQAFGRIDVVVFSAGTLTPRSNLEVPVEQFDHMIAINLRAPFFLMAGAAKVMRREAVPGTMVAVFGLPSEGDASPAAYDAAQGGLAALARRFAADWHDDGIRVIGLDAGGCAAVYQPGSTLSVEPARDPRSPQDVAAALVSLAADPAAPPSGSIVHVDQVGLFAPA